MIGCESNNVKVPMLLFQISNLFLRLFFKLFPDKFGGLKFSFECCPVVRECSVFSNVVVVVVVVV